MAITVMLETPYGETRETYVRINSVSASNHGVTSSVLFRGYLSKEAFQSAASYTWEKELEMMLDVSAPLWAQAYGKLKQMPDFAEATDC